MQKVEFTFMVVAFICLFVIVIRAKPSLWGGIKSTEMQKRLDNKDKILAIVASVCFSIAMALLFTRI
ncbi:hypothetical protein [Desulfuromonas sp. AOP6]|uniref:hypothetical protein n=1 Tax=Desulfuromonas sp. AOP6 TaxID=1566351 RepID=UPI0012DE804B|nr:hypothetical protein [Desulfuromonas sp. AOP6]